MDSTSPWLRWRVLLVATLACTPLKIVSGWTWPMRLRRMLGLLAFLYALLHVAVYLALDRAFDWTAIIADPVKRRFILAGFAAFVVLVPLAATSTNASVKRLGFTRWKRLHRLAYLAPAVAVVHFLWRVKRDVDEPAAYGIVLAALLVVRVVAHLHSQDSPPRFRSQVLTRTLPSGSRQSRSCVRRRFREW